MGRMYSRLGAGGNVLNVDVQNQLVQWATDPAVDADVFVTCTGESGAGYRQLFASGSAGAQAAPWLSVAMPCTFELVAPNGTVLARSTVGEAGVPIATTPPAGDGATTTGTTPATTDAGVITPGYVPAPAPSGDLIAGVPNMYLGIGAAALFGLIALKKKR